MDKRTWQIQQAKQRLSEIIRYAASEGPQILTHRGKAIAWIISAKDYENLTNPRENIVDFFQRSPHRDVELTK